MNKTKLEALRQKFFNHCVDPYRTDDNMEESKAPINMYAEDVWQWILSNCLQKEEEKWISVEDKLPEDRIGVLAYISDEDFITHCHYEYKINQWLASDDYRSLDNSIVTHWQPLPKSPIK